MAWNSPAVNTWYSSSTLTPNRALVPRVPLSSVLCITKHLCVCHHFKSTLEELEKVVFFRTTALWTRWWIGIPRVSWMQCCPPPKMQDVQFTSRRLLSVQVNLLPGLTRATCAISHITSVAMTLVTSWCIVTIGLRKVAAMAARAFIYIWAKHKEKDQGTDRILLVA